MKTVSKEEKKDILIFQFHWDLVRNQQSYSRCCCCDILFRLILILVLSFTGSVQAQLVQTLRGEVVDKVSQSPLPGALILVTDSDPINGCSSDENGKFKLLVPVGKITLKVSFLGYKEQQLQNLIVNAGKELVITVQLEEETHFMKEIEVSAKQERNRALNQLSEVSSRMFSVEETQKYAAALNDPARMATSFAGVIQSGNGNNTISIRGNSPNGLLWRMEGADIPNPNHFSSVGTSGGGISILSTQLLGNSDFMTGAFASEYGNALSGVFDLRLRKGNNQKREYTAQLNFYGVDVAAEGPFKKGYEGSYLLNYRYSTLLLMGKMGLPIGDAITQFQDLSLNISLPTKKCGNFGIFGFGGTSSQTTEAYKDSMKWKEDPFYRLNTQFYANTAAIGLNHAKLFGNRSYLKTALVFSGTSNGYAEDQLNDLYIPEKQYREDYLQNRLTLSSAFTCKVNARANFRTGIILTRLGYDLSKKAITDSSEILVERISAGGETYSDQAYFQFKYLFTEKITSNIGLHFLHLLLNNSYSLEPRASLRFDIGQRQAISAGYGLHSQIQPIGVYFSKQIDSNGLYHYPNKELELSKAHHFVLGYEIGLSTYSRIKTELYYQYLFNIPVATDTNNTFSMLNAVDGFTSTSLNNKGLGKNYGMELTIERFLKNDFYFILSSSLYESKYRASNHKWYNTLYNTNFAFSFTAGKDWTLSEKRKKRVIGTNLKIIYTGGYRYTPIDLDSSIATGYEQPDQSRSFEKRNPDYFRLDVRISLKRNFKHITSIVAFDIQNATNKKNIAGRYYDAKSRSIKYFYQMGIIPLLSYRIEF